MDRIEPSQKPPLTITVIVTVLIILGSILFTHLTAGSTTQENQLYWLVDRAAGVTAYELLALSSILGLSMTAKAWDRWGMRKWAKQLHQYTTLLVIPFIALHLFGLLMDSSVPFTWRALIVPFSASYKPILSALGTLSVYGVLILIVTSYLREHMSANVWRKIHFLAFPMFIAVTIHGFMIGTDSYRFIGFLFYAVPLTIVAWLSVRRFLSR